jgi:hypothetical protein
MEQILKQCKTDDHNGSVMKHEWIEQGYLEGD